MRLFKRRPNYQHDWQKPENSVWFKVGSGANNKAVVFVQTGSGFSLIWASKKSYDDPLDARFAAEIFLRDRLARLLSEGSEPDTGSEREAKIKAYMEGSVRDEV